MHLSLFEDKPNLDEIYFKIDMLKKFTQYSIDEIPNLIFNGIKGSGKSTKVYAFLCTMFCDKVYNLKTNEIEIDKKKVFYKSSIYHIEVDILELLNNEKLFFSNFLKEYSSTRNIGLGLPKIIYIKNADKMNKNSFLSFRNIIENNWRSSRFIFETCNCSLFPSSLSSRFLIIRVPLPSKEEIFNCLINYLKKKEIKIKKKDLEIIIKKSSNFNGNNCNLKIIMGHLRYFLSTNNHLNFYYNNFIDNIIELIIKKTFNFSELNIIKNYIQEMYINLVDLDNSILEIYHKLSNKFRTNTIFLHNFLILTTEFEIKLKKGNKIFIQFENYIIKTILMIKKYVYNCNLKI